MQFISRKKTRAKSEFFQEVERVTLSYAPATTDRQTLIISFFEYKPQLQQRFTMGVYDHAEGIYRISKLS